MTGNPNDRPEPRQRTGSAYTRVLMAPPASSLSDLARRSEQALSRTGYGARSARLLRRVGGAGVRRSRRLLARADRLRYRDEAAYLEHVVADAIAAARADA